MARRVLEWQLVLLLVIGIVIAGRYAYSAVVWPLTAPNQIGTNQSGQLTARRDIIVAEQHQTFARFVDAKAKGVLKVASLGFGRAKLYFQWEALNLYGIRIGEKQSIRWNRTDNPGEVLVKVPPLDLLQSKIFLEPDKYVMLDIERSVWVDEESRKSEYRTEQVKQTETEARKLLVDPSLALIAKAVVGEHVRDILNQGLTTDKIHTVIVEFDKATVSAPAMADGRR